jgi:hypothetical protein
MTHVQEHMEIKTVDGLSVHEVAKRMVTPKHPWLIDPRKSRRIGYWDATTSVSATG